MRMKGLLRPKREVERSDDHGDDQPRSADCTQGCVLPISWGVLFHQEGHKDGADRSVADVHTQPEQVDREEVEPTQAFHELKYSMADQFVI
jgi:hypothetical protein